MNTQDILEAAITDRIQSLIQELKKNTSKEKADDVLKNMDLAQKIIDSLPQHQQDVINQILNQTVDDYADIELALYKEGLLDGIRIMKYLQKL